MKNFLKAFTMMVVAASLYSCGNNANTDQAQGKEEEKVETPATAPAAEPKAEDSSATTAAPADSNTVKEENQAK